MSLNGEECEVEEALVETNNSLPILNTSILQVTEELFPANYPIGIPLDLGIELQIDCQGADEIELQHHPLEVSILPKVDFGIPEETMEFPRH